MQIPAYHHPPWLDLPVPLTETILERLPLSDYLRFAAVCRRWRSIQTSRRRRHSPSPPPMLRLPWHLLIKPFHKTLPFRSPFEGGKTFTIPLPSPSSSPLLINPLDHGWLLIADQGTPNLFNPVTGAEIALPPLINAAAFPSVLAVAISPPPLNYSVSVIGSSTVFLHRWFHSSWMEFDLPNGYKPVRMPLSISGKALLHSIASL